MNYLIALDPQERRLMIFFVSASTKTFMNPSVSPFSAHGRLASSELAIKAFCPDFRTSASVIPALPNGGSM
jgi:hypothetical protein